jgi:hypothetical protein
MKVQGERAVNENLLLTLEFLFHCQHHNLSRSFASSRRAYEVCLDCGKEFSHSLHAMSSIESAVERDSGTGTITIRSGLPQ